MQPNKHQSEKKIKNQQTVNTDLTDWARNWWKQLEKHKVRCLRSERKNENWAKKREKKGRGGGVPSREKKRKEAALGEKSKEINVWEGISKRGELRVVIGLVGQKNEIRKG